MMGRAETGQRTVEDYPPVTLAQLRKAVNSDAESPCRFAEADYVYVTLPDGGLARVDLLRRETNLGMTMTHMICPACRHASRTLRIVPTPAGKGLACVRDLRRIFGAKYKSQLRKPRGLT
jgi:hypothetical protein